LPAELDKQLAAAAAEGFMPDDWVFMWAASSLICRILEIQQNFWHERGGNRKSKHQITRQQGGGGGALNFRQVSRETEKWGESLCIFHANFVATL
jgi:hypothetical protein